MTRTRFSTFAFLFTTLLLATFFSKNIYAEEILDEEYGFSLDVPEGFYLEELTNDRMGLHFKHDRMAVELVLRIYSQEVYKTCSQSLSESLKKLHANFEQVESFLWNKTDCAITSFSTNALNVIGFEGWAVAVTLPEKNSNLVILCYANKDKANDCQQFIFSTINSLELKNRNNSDSGIMLTFALNDKTTENLTLEIAGKTINTNVEKLAKTGAELVVKCEYEILKLYINNKQWKEAWQRYYRMIYKDSFPRFNTIAKDIEKALMPIAKNKNKENPQVALNEMLLDWVQNFEYERQLNGTDFTNPLDAITGSASDCDSRSLLMCILLNQMGIDSVLFISNEYNHAVYGTLVDVPGAKIEVDGKWFLLGETTAKNIKPGLIAANQNNTENWIPVVFD